MSSFPRLIPAFLSALLCACSAGGSGARLLVGATHTVEDSGLLAVLLAAFRAANPDENVQVIVAGSGEILQYGRRGDLDVLITHAPADEATFMADGYGLDRRPVMWNEFLLLAPLADPAAVAGETDVIVALRKVADSRSRFVSRGDFSGTHQRELELWVAAGTRPPDTSHVEAGTGMADALRIASVQQAYILSDIATWSSLRAELDLIEASRGDPHLLNTYSVIRVADARNPEAAERWVDWLTGPEGQAVIRAFGGESELFRPGAPAASSQPRRDS